MRRIAFGAVLAATLAFGAWHGARHVRAVPRILPNGTAILANGWSLTPAGAQIVLPGDMPGSIAVSKDGRYAYVNTCGYHDHSVSAVDLQTQKIVSSVDLGVNWYGVSLTPDGSELLVSAGSTRGRSRGRDDEKPASAIYPAEDRAAILRLAVNEGSLSPRRGLEIPGLDPTVRYVAGLRFLANGDLLAVNIQNNRVYRLSPDAKTVVASAAVGYRPYAAAESPDGATVAVSNWGESSVDLLRASDLSRIATVKVGMHPNALTFAPDGRLFVACASSNSVFVIQNRQVTETIRTSLGEEDRIGSAPIAMAMDASRHRIYVANAGNNAVAVVDFGTPGQSVVRGFIPTGRYPSAVALTPNGQVLLVGNAKGLRNQPNVSAEQIATFGQGGVTARRPFTYIAKQLQGVLSVIPVPDDGQLAAFTRQAIANRPAPPKHPVDASLLAAMRKIEHVVYVIRENRTYDQVLGDISKGNGEPALTIFGGKITPNAHRLVNDFTLFDNLYCDGETSQVGHQWTDAAYATDFNEKNWILNYSGRGEVLADPRLNSSPAGYLWDMAQRHGKTTRIYGEYVKWQEDHDSAEGEVKNDPEKFGCSAAFEEVFARGGRDTDKVDVFLKEMRERVASGKPWWNLMVMALPEDHTYGVTPGKNTPEACIANNDLAVGRLIDAISKSPLWKKTAIFVIQDDSQSGPDHVDAHRTVGFIASPYVRRGYLDSTHYTTSSMLRTMELILGLPPMTQYDAVATPMHRSFTQIPDFRPWTWVPPKVDVNAMNPTKGDLVERSLKLDLSDIDRADEQEFNAILWEWCKPGVPMPAPRHTSAR